MTDEEERKLIEEISSKFYVVTKEKAKEDILKNLVQGHEIANKIVLDMINRGESLEQIKEYLVKATSVKGKNAMKKVVGLNKKGIDR